MRMMFTRMGSFVPEKSVKLDDGGTAKVSAQQIAAFKALDTFDERLKMMSDVPAIGAQFLETQRESIGKTAISEIVNRSARAVAFEDKAKQNITGIDQAQGFFTGLEKVLVGETAQLSAERKSQSNIAVAQVSGRRDLEGTVLKMVEDTIATVDLSGLDYDTAGKLRNQMRLDDAMGVNPVESGIKVLEEAKGRRAAFGIIPAGGSVSQEDKDLINRQIDALRAVEAALLEIRPAVARPAQARNARPGEAALPGALIP